MAHIIVYYVATICYTLAQVTNLINCFPKLLRPQPCLAQHLVCSNFDDKVFSLSPTAKPEPDPAALISPSTGLSRAERRCQTVSRRLSVCTEAREIQGDQRKHLPGCSSGTTTLANLAKVWPSLFQMAVPELHSAGQKLGHSFLITLYYVCSTK